MWRHFLTVIWVLIGWLRGLRTSFVVTGLSDPYSILIVPQHSYWLSNGTSKDLTPLRYRRLGEWYCTLPLWERIMSCLRPFKWYGDLTAISHFSVVTYLSSKNKSKTSSLGHGFWPLLDYGYMKTACFRQFDVSSECGINFTFLSYPRYFWETVPGTFFQRDLRPWQGKVWKDPTKKAENTSAFLNLVLLQFTRIFIVLSKSYQLGLDGVHNLSCGLWVLK